MNKNSSQHADVFFTVKKLLSIDEFLQQRGCSPSRRYGDKSVYCCPIHKDKTPSFYVYKKSDGDDFYCFGCKKGGSAVHLKSYLDNEKFGKSLLYFCDKLKIKTNSKINIEDILDDELFSFKKESFDIEKKYELCLFRYSSSLNMGNMSISNFLNTVSALQKIYEERDEIRIGEMLNGRI
jgi:hypothetical protein